MAGQHSIQPYFLTSHEITVAKIQAAAAIVTSDTAKFELKAAANAFLMKEFKLEDNKDTPSPDNVP